MKRFINVLTWALFAVAVALLAYQTWLAVQGKQPDYDEQLSAALVAGLVTLTWLTNLGRLLLGMEETQADWLTALGLVTAGLAVDVGVALSVLIGFTFPPRLALVVIVAHAVAHAFQAIVRAIAKAKDDGLFSGAFMPESERIKTLEQKLAVAQATQQAPKAKEYKRTCPHCGEDCVGTSARSASAALSAHIGWCEQNPQSRRYSEDGKQRERIEA